VIAALASISPRERWQ
jgi:hypothetical protein